MMHNAFIIFAGFASIAAIYWAIAAIELYVFTALDAKSR
jgi:hypothetical protein